MELRAVIGMKHHRPRRVLHVVLEQEFRATEAAGYTVHASVVL